MFFAILLFNALHPGTVLVGPESEFPKKKTRKERKREKKARKEAEAGRGTNGLQLV